jgi:hypothetical protein
MALVGVAMLTFALHYNIIYISYRIKSFIKYKILKHPEPDPVEVLTELMPSILVAVTVAKMSKDIDKALKKHREKIKCQK